jgi:uncharacterized protein (TIGR02597 family)
MIYPMTTSIPLIHVNPKIDLDDRAISIYFRPLSVVRNFSLFPVLVKIRLALLLFALWPLSVRATTVSVSTVPCGFETLTVPATSATQTTTTYLTLPLLNAPVFSGGVTVLSTDTLTVAGSPWTAGEFTAAGSPYFVAITSGKQAGRFLLITRNTTNALAVAITDQSTQSTGLNATGFSVEPNDNFQIIPGDTLSSYFGENTTASPLLLRGGTSATTADTVSIYEPVLGSSLVYYFNTTSKTWTSTTASGSQNNVIIYPEAVLGITRRPNGAQLNLEMTGNVPQVSPLIKTIGGGKAVYGSTGLPIYTRLNGLAFAGWVQSNSVTTADTVGLWNPTLAAWQVYYQLPNQNGVAGQWRLSGNATTDQSGLAIQAGTGFQITKRANLSGASSFLAEPLSYVPEFENHRDENEHGPRLDGNSPLRPEPGPWPSLDPPLALRRSGLCPLQHRAWQYRCGIARGRFPEDGGEFHDLREQRGLQQFVHPSFRSGLHFSGRRLRRRQ